MLTFLADPYQFTRGIKSQWNVSLPLQPRFARTPRIRSFPFVFRKVRGRSQALCPSVRAEACIRGVIRCNPQMKGCCLVLIFRCVFCVFFFAFVFHLTDSRSIVRCVRKIGTVRLNLHTLNGCATVELSSYIASLLPERLTSYHIPSCSQPTDVNP